MLSAAAEELQVAIREYKAELQRLREAIKVAKNQKATLEEEINSATEKLKATLSAEEHAQDAVVDAQKLLDKATQKYTALLDESTALKTEISNLLQKQSDLLQTIETTQTEFEAAVARNQASEAVFKKEQSTRERKLQTLAAKILEKAQLLEKQEQEDMITRQSLATWQRTLEEKDKNLRIRESKVEQGEGKLIQNSNLLNL